MEKYNSFNFLKKLSFERIGGSSKEKEAARLIEQEINKLGLEAKIETFEVDFPIIKKATLVTSNNKEYKVTGYGMSGNTSSLGLTKQFKYIQEGFDVDIEDIEDKIVLIHQRFTVKLYEKLVKKNVAGIIVFSGSIYDEEDKTDLGINTLREINYSKGKIPAVTLRAIDAHNLILENPKEITLTLVEEENKATSQNVITEIKGEKEDEIIVFTAHYDSVVYSSGAYDNGTGTIALLELINYYINNKPKRTLKFIFCGSEEKGLLGSKAYTNDHIEELEQYKLCINIDMLAVVLGVDIACCTSEQCVVNYLDFLAKEVGFALKPYQGVYSSDSTPFADKGIPAISFARLAPQGGMVIHNRKDVIDYLDEKNYLNTMEFIKQFTYKMINSYTFPIPKSIPDNMKLELDYYLFRKERPQN